MSQPGQPLHIGSDTSTSKRYAGDIGRYAVRRQVIDEYLSRENPGRHGRTAIITAGAPGSGKSTTLRQMVAGLDDYRVLDADDVKDMLIDLALNEGIYDDVLRRQLSDGHNIAPGELSSLVHDESVELIDRIRTICVDRKENIIIEGTLTWGPQGPKLFRELAAAEYHDLQVFAVDTKRHVAQEQALSRWWSGRRDWIDQHDARGGRFVAPESIEKCYRAGDDTSICARNAFAIFDLAQSGDIADVRLRVLCRTLTGGLEILRDETFKA